MKPNDPSPLSREQIDALREAWQPEAALPDDFAGRVVAVARRQQRVRRAVAGSVVALAAAALFAWSQQQSQTIAEVVQPETAPVMVAPPPAVAAPTMIAEGGRLPQPRTERFGPPPPRDADLIASAIVLPMERAVKSRRHYRDSFRELGDEYDGLADIYFDESVQ